ncbi:hypothetical protein B0H14DRAFT_3452896 [Mycena olivaceomarginata]|nr:hypothetical protein B0H14DRAFT_3452896 [Mycena olivaceomarginata]
MAEGNLLGYEPRCMVWYVIFALVAPHSNENPLFPSTRTDQLIQTAINGTTCGEHWKVAHALHHAPCEDARDGPLSQCEMNLEVRAHLKFGNMLAQTRGYHRIIIWVPDSERVKKGADLVGGIVLGERIRRRNAQVLRCSPFPANSALDPSGV